MAQKKIYIIFSCQTIVKNLYQYFLGKIFIYYVHYLFHNLIIFIILLFDNLNLQVIISLYLYIYEALKLIPLYRGVIFNIIYFIVLILILVHKK